jgi:hypothetical protein
MKRILLKIIILFVIILPCIYFGGQIELMLMIVVDAVIHISMHTLNGT